MPIRRALLWVSSVIAAALTCVPAVYLVIRAQEASPDSRELFFKLRTLELLGNTLGLALTVTLCSALIALPLAWLTTSTNLPGRRAWSVLLSLPLAVPSFIGGYVLLAALGRGGLLDNWGITPPSIYGFRGAVFALTFSTFPFLLLPFRAVFIQQNQSLIETAQSLGYSPLQAFLRANSPQLIHAFRSGGLLIAFYVLSDFGAVSLLQYDTFSRAIFMQLEGSFDRSLAALWSLGLMALSISVLLLAELGAGQRIQMSARLSRGLRPFQLAWLKAPALALCTFVAAAGIGLPIAVIGVWLLRAHPASSEASILEPTLNSVTASGLATVATCLCVFPLAYLSARSKHLGARLLSRMSYTSYALPPIVVALSLVSLGIQVMPAIYGTLAMLVFAHTVRFAPQALGPLQSSFTALSPSLSEAGASLGRHPLWVALKVGLPLIRPGIMAGGALVFLTAMKELPATLLLAPVGFSTLATRIWSATAEGHFAEGALPSLILILASSISVALTLRQERRGSGSTTRSGNS